MNYPQYNNQYQYYNPPQAPQPQQYVQPTTTTLNLNSTFTQRTSVAQVSISDYTLNLSDLKLNFACTDKGGSAAFWVMFLRFLL